MAKFHANDKMDCTELLEFARNAGCGLTAGYIGNIEQWGDNRCFMIWAGADKIWSADCNAVTRRTVSEGYAIVKLYAKGYNAGKLAAK